MHGGLVYCMRCWCEKWFVQLENDVLFSARGLKAYKWIQIYNLYKIYYFI